MIALSTIAGWVGMILILVAYFLVSSERVSGESYIQLLNLFGALGIIWNTFEQKAWPAMTLNIAWVVIAIMIILSVNKSSSNAKRI